MLKDEQLKAFGSLAISYAFLDWKVTNALSWLRQEDPDMGAKRMAEARTSFCSKLKEIRSLAEQTALGHGDKGKQVCAKIGDAADKVQKASQRRNGLIHSHLRF